jgi:hypothetical protein
LPGRFVGRFAKIICDNLAADKIEEIEKQEEALEKWNLSDPDNSDDDT